MGRLSGWPGRQPFQDRMTTNSTTAPAVPASAANQSEPALSVVVAIIAGGTDAIKNCLTALESGVRTHAAECIVPFDNRVERVAELAARFPWVKFVDARAEIDASHFGDFSREHHDILRAIGLRQAQGKIVALLEDHAAPS